MTFDPNKNPADPPGGPGTPINASVVKPASLWQNVTQHPKTTAAGLLIAVTTVAGVLTSQGVSLGHVGTGTVVTLASALASALLGLLAKDPS